MILAEICHYVAQSGPVTTGTVAVHFDLEASVTEAMLTTLAAHGRVTAVDAAAGCAACGGSCHGSSKACSSAAGQGATVWRAPNQIAGGFHRA